MKFFKCPICGKIVGMVNEVKVPTICCGKPMEEMIPNTSDGAVEKHVPTFVKIGNTVTVQVGAVSHPMTEEHHIDWVAIETDMGNQRKVLKHNDLPRAKFALLDNERIKAVYAYCNLHGLYKNK